MRRASSYLTSVSRRGGRVVDAQVFETGGTLRGSECESHPRRPITWSTLTWSDIRSCDPFRAHAGWLRRSAGRPSLARERADDRTGRGANGVKAHWPIASSAMVMAGGPGVLAKRRNAHGEQPRRAADHHVHLDAGCAGGGKFKQVRLLPNHHARGVATVTSPSSALADRCGPQVRRLRPGEPGRDHQDVRHRDIGPLQHVVGRCQRSGRHSRMGQGASQPEFFPAQGLEC